MAFAVGELGLRLEEFWDMPWCEFLIKSFAYSRMSEERMRHTRLIAYYSAVGSHLKTESLPKSLQSFLPIGDEGKVKKSKISPEMMEIWNKRMREYNELKRIREQQQSKDN